MLLRNDARRGRDDFLDIALSLPFQTEVNTGFGVLAKVYLDALTHINNGTRVRDPNAPGVNVAKEMALDLCEETFPGVKNPKSEVERGFRFWDVVSVVFCRIIPGRMGARWVCDGGSAFFFCQACRFAGQADSSPEAQVRAMCYCWSLWASVRSAHLHHQTYHHRHHLASLIWA